MQVAYCQLYAVRRPADSYDHRPADSCVDNLNPAPPLIPESSLRPKGFANVVFQS